VQSARARLVATAPPHLKAELATILKEMVGLARENEIKNRIESARAKINAGTTQDALISGDWSEVRAQGQRELEQQQAMLDNTMEKLAALQKRQADVESLMLSA
jgi:hypothetical protein